MKGEGDPLKSFIRGGYRLLILALLEKSVMHGYELLKSLERITGERPKISTLYTILKEMEESGLLESRKVDRKRLYRISERGKKKLQEFRENVSMGALKMIEVILSTNLKVRS